MAGLQPEKVGDVDSGTGSDVELGGMTAEEQAAFDAMKSGRDLPGEGDGGDGEADHDLAADDHDGAGDTGDVGDTGDTGAAAGDAVPDAGDTESRPPPKTISYGKYQRELKKAQTAAEALRTRLDGSEKERTKEREERLRLDERTKLLLEAINTPRPKPEAAQKPDEDPEPNKDDDPLGHLEWRNRRLEKTVSDLQSGRQRDVEQTTARNAEQEVYMAFTADVERAAQRDPAFAEMFVHLRESRYQELGYIMGGIDVNDKDAVAALTPEQQMRLSSDIQQTFYNEQMLVARQALAQGRSPAREVANLARARGWRPKAAAPAPKPNGSAAAPAPRAAAAAAKSVTEELATIRDGLEASKSLSDTGGAPGGNITPERLAAMSSEEFEEYYNSIPKRQLDRLMGKVQQ